MTKKLKLTSKVSRAKSAPGIFVLPVASKKKLPYFAICVSDILSIKFPQTYVVGGAVRNILLDKKIVDVDIATQATPREIIELLKAGGINFSADHQKLGVVVAKSPLGQSVEITTFRTETYGKSRFPKVKFARTARQDSRRRDFTVNALYYSLNDNSVQDFHGGIEDIKKLSLKFIGRAVKKIQEDPLRIMRAYKFSLQYNLKIDESTEEILQTNKHLLKHVSAARLNREIESISSAKLRKLLKKVIHNNS